MKYKELNIGDWYGRPDLIGFILIRTATSYDDNLPSTRDFATTKIVEGPDIVSPKYLNYYEI